jgi:hypothetical protein
MSTDDEAARKSKAEHLREQISKYKKKDDAGEGEESSDEPESKSPAGKSPREFIHERMRELDEEDK